MFSDYSQSLTDLRTVSDHCPTNSDNIFGSQKLKNRSKTVLRKFGERNINENIIPKIRRNFNVKK